MMKGTRVGDDNGQEDRTIRPIFKIFKVGLFVLGFIVAGGIVMFWVLDHI